MTKHTLTLALALAGFATATPARATEQLSLNGKWQIAFDDQNAGKREQWQFDTNLSQQKLQPATIPSSWENIRAGYEGVAWYRKQFDVPDNWKGKSIRLHFDACSYLTEVWLNGELVDYHEGGYDPFEFTIDNIVHYGKTNTLILRVISPIVTHDDLVIDGMAKWEAPHWRGALIAGVWQDAYVTVTEKTYVKDLFVEAALDGTLKLNLTAVNAGVKNKESVITCTIRHHTQPSVNETDKACEETASHANSAPSANASHANSAPPASASHANDAPSGNASHANGVPQVSPGSSPRDPGYSTIKKSRPEWAPQVCSTTETHTLEPGENSLVTQLRIPQHDLKLWSPDTPHLYEATVTIDGKDPRTVRFGVREFTLTPTGFLLNGKPFYMKAGFWEGLYPVGLAVPDNPEMLRKEITLAKQAHFNTLRPWRKPPVPWLLDMADELGILMIGAPALECMNEKPAIAGQMNRRVFHEIESMVRRDRNHPSIIIWELFNEVKRDAIARLKHESSLRARALDPTRIVIDESGGWAGGCKAYLPRTREYTPFNEMHTYEKAPVRQSVYDRYLKLADTGQKIAGWAKLAPGAVGIVSEVGYGSLPDLESNMRDFRAKGNPLAPTYTSHQTLYESMKKVMAEIGLDEIFGDISRMSLASQQVQRDGNKQMLEALRLNPRLSGFCIHAYTDGDWVIGAGVLDIWRNPKLQYEMLKQVNAPLYISARVEPANIYAGRQVSIKSSIVSELDTPQKGTVTLTLTTSKGQPLWTKTTPVEAPWGVTPVLAEKITIPATAAGECTLSATFTPAPTENCKLKTENSFLCHVFPPLRPGDITPPRPLVVIGKSKLNTWLDKHGVAYAEKLPDADTLNTPAPKSQDGNNINLPRRSEAPPGEILPIIITNISDPTPAELETFRAVFKKVEQGATLVMLNPPLKRTNYVPANPPAKETAASDNPFYTSGVFPLDLPARTAKGHWVSNNHAIAPAHPYFDGLPSKCFMGQLYADIAPMQTIMGLKEKPIVSSVSWMIDRSYKGITEAWWGSDLTRVPHGQGSIVLSTLSIIPNLDADPVAGILMKNIINATKY